MQVHQARGEKILATAGTNVDDHEHHLQQEIQTRALGGVEDVSQAACRSEQPVVVAHHARGLSFLLLDHALFQSSIWA